MKRCYENVHVAEITLDMVISKKYRFRNLKSSKIHEIIAFFES